MSSLAAPRSAVGRWVTRTIVGAAARSVLCALALCLVSASVRGNGRALTAVAIAAGSRGPATSATPLPIACEATTPSREREGTLAQLTTIDPAANAAEGDHTVPPRALTERSTSSAAS